jgi:hypothetical protein
LLQQRVKHEIILANDAEKARDENSEQAIPDNPGKRCRYAWDRWFRFAVCAAGG